MTLSTNNNTSVLPFYGSTDFWEGAKEQDYKKSYAFDYTYCLATPANMILPFQIIRPHSNNPIREVRLYKKGNSNPIRYILREMNESGLQVVSFAEYGYDIIVYPGILPMPLNMFDGQYYISIHDGRYSWYSDIFTVVHDLSKYVKLEWWDAEDLIFRKGRILYKNPSFKNTLYLCTELGKPEYDFKDEGEQRDGYFFPEKQISEKTYKCTVLGPEYLCDVMRLIRMSDFIKITDQLGRIYWCDTFLITPKWQTQGNLASIDIEFQTDTVVKKIGKGTIITNNIGDFNIDFNIDFKNGGYTKVENIKERNGYLRENGTFSNSDILICKYTDEIICNKGDLFYYRGRGEYEAVSILYKKGGEIVGNEKIKSLKEYKKIIIPGDVDSVIFSSYSEAGTTVVLDILYKK